MPQGRVLSTDPNAGEPVTAPSSPRVLSTDPNAGEPLRVNSRAQTWSDRLGLNEPVPSMPSLGAAEPLAAASAGFMRGVGAGAVDLAQGATARVRNAVARGGDPLTREIFGAVPVAQQQDVATAPQNLSGKIGGMLPDVAAMAVPIGKGSEAVKDVATKVLPSAARAGAKFQEVMGAAKNIPIDVKEVGDVALRINQLAERGGSMPMAVRKILNRMTDPNKPAMAYEESRDFASNISRLSADEMKRLTPIVRREVAQLSAALNKANAEAAKVAGKGAEYKAAMREYSRAMQMRDALDAVIKKAKRAALPVAAGGGAAYWLGR